MAAFLSASLCAELRGGAVSWVPGTLQSDAQNLVSTPRGAVSTDAIHLASAQGRGCDWAGAVGSGNREPQVVRGEAPNTRGM